jgi:transposase
LFSTALDIISPPASPYPATSHLFTSRPTHPSSNPIENVWQYLRGNKLSNTIYENYDDILEKACQAWMFFANDKEQVASITTRQWAKVNL